MSQIELTACARLTSSHDVDPATAPEEHHPVLEGGYDLEALADSVLATIGAPTGQTRAESIAPDPLITSRVAAHAGHFWAL